MYWPSVKNTDLQFLVFVCTCVCVCKTSNISSHLRNTGGERQLERVRFNWGVLVQSHDIAVAGLVGVRVLIVRKETVVS